MGRWAGALGAFSSTRGRAWKEGRRADARDCVRWMGVTGLRKFILGGTDCEASRETGPRGMAVTGTSASEKGVPKR